MATINTVEITIDDERKELYLGETLTSGSRYRLTLADGAARLGEGADAILLIDGTPPPAWPGKDAGAPLTLATAQFALDGEAAYCDIDLDTDSLQSFATRMPVGTVIHATLVLHSRELAENVATGSVAIKLVRVTTNAVSGAPVIYRGETGATGQAGADGKSAYELAVENGFEGTLEEWLESLRGAPGERGASGRDGRDGAPGQNGADGRDGSDGQDGQDGQDGSDGQDGQDGADGQDGKSAYELAVENGFEGSLQAWLQSLQGAAADGNWVYCPDDGNWYKVCAQLNTLGEVTLYVDETSATGGSEGTPPGTQYVTLATAQTVTGAKTFTTAPTIDTSGNAWGEEGRRHLILKGKIARSDTSVRMQDHQIVFTDPAGFVVGYIENMRELGQNRFNIHVIDRTGAKDVFFTFGFDSANAPYATVNVHPPSSTASDDSDRSTSTATPDPAKFGVATVGWANDPAQGRNNIVHKTGDETIGGVKNFTSRPQYGGKDLALQEGVQALDDQVQAASANAEAASANAEAASADAAAALTQAQTALETAQSARRTAAANTTAIEQVRTSANTALANAAAAADASAAALSRATNAETSAAAAASTATTAAANASTALTRANTAISDAAGAATAAAAAQTTADAAAADAAEALTAAAAARKERYVFKGESKLAGDRPWVMASLVRDTAKTFRVTISCVTEGKVSALNRYSATHADTFTLADGLGAGATAVKWGSRVNRNVAWKEDARTFTVAGGGAFTLDLAVVSNWTVTIEEI